MRFLILLLIFFLISPAPAAHVEVQVRNHVSGTVNSRRVALKLQQPGAVVAGPWLVAGDYVIQVTDTNGLTTFSNVLAGDYSLTIYGSPERSFVFTVPDTNGVVNAAQLTGTNSTPNYYTAAQIQALLGSVGQGAIIAAGALTNQHATNVFFPQPLQLGSVAGDSGYIRFVDQNQGTTNLVGIHAGSLVGLTTTVGVIGGVGLSGGNVSATTYTGSGIGLTDVPAASLTGTIDDARLPNTITSDITGNAATATMATNLVWDQRFNVKNFGARGDSVTDDTAAILAAFTAAKANGGGNVYFPGLTNNNFYAVTLSGNAGAINVTNAHNITMSGDGDASFIKLVDTVNNNVAVVKIWTSTNFNMRNFRVSGGSDIRAFASNENEGINPIFCTNGVAENITVEHVLADAWDLDWCYGFSFHNLVSRHIGGSGWKPNGYNFTLFGGRMDNCGKTATEADRGGLVIPDAYGVSVFGVSITNCNPSIYLSGSQRVLVEGVHCWMTNNTFTNIYVFGGTDLNIANSTFTGGYGVWTTNNIGGSSGPTGLTLSENKFWTTTMLHVQTDVTDLQVFGNKHNSALNPLGSVSAHSIFLVGSIRAAIQKNNIRVNGTAIYFTGVNHEMQVSDNYFGTYVSQAIYAPNNSAVATNFYAADNIFNQAGVNSISFSDSLSVSNGFFKGNLMKGMFRLQGGSHFISGNKLEAGMLIYNTACVSNVIIGNFFGNTNWFASQAPQNSYWLNNTGDASATTNNADYIALRFTRGWLNSSNTVASWLAAPRYAGDVYFPPASNGVQYVLYSTNGAGAATTAWTRTNYYGPN